MFDIDDTFLQAAGYGDVSGERREELVRELTADLTDRVTTRLVDGLTKDELTEFSALVDADDSERAKQWLKVNVPNYHDSEDFIELQKTADASKDDVVRDYAVFSWLEKHKPDFHAIIEEEMKQLATESRQLRENVAKRLAR